MKRFLALIFLTGLISITPLASWAAPLSAGTTLTINPGVCSSGTLVSGSAFAVGFNRVPSDACLSPGLNGQVIAPGTDGGIVVGKNQISGGQESAPSSANTTPGQIDAAWLFFSAYGTDFTPAGTTNVFDSLSCIGSGCVGKTELNSWNIAWNGNTPPDGISMGGGVVDAWIVSGSAYSLYYHLPASGPVFGDQPYTLHLEGKIVPMTAPSGACPPPTIFGDVFPDETDNTAVAFDPEPGGVLVDAERIVLPPGTTSVQFTLINQGGIVPPPPPPHNGNLTGRRVILGFTDPKTITLSGGFLRAGEWGTVTCSVVTVGNLQPGVNRVAFNMVQGGGREARLSDRDTFTFIVPSGP